MIVTLAQNAAPTVQTILGNRFTLDGSDELEWRLARICEKVLSGVRGIIPRNKLEALMLGGGYGRGEGGVLCTEAGDRAYNDMEYYVLVRGNRFLNRHLYQEQLHHLAEELSFAAGVEIEFKIISLAELRRSSISMFYHDLVMGHRWLCGDEILLAGCGHHRAAECIPLSEATRLLMNRCSGLLFAREKLAQKSLTAEDADFIGRNLAKARLAFGDAVLTVFGHYHWSCLERHNRLLCLSVPETLPWLANVRHHHIEGVRFKLHPARVAADMAVLRAQHEELTSFGLQLWLWLEGRRLGDDFATALDYAVSKTDKCPETHFWRNYLVIARTLGPQELLVGKPAHHPRQRILHALALLLWEPSALCDLALLGYLQTELNTKESTFTGLVSAYRTLWQKVG